MNKKTVEDNRLYRFNITIQVIKMENKLPIRKKNRLLNHDYSSCGVYFITICTQEKKCLFWSQEQPNFVGEDIILPPFLFFKKTVYKTK